MTSKQFEELCRLFLANELGIPVEEIHSGEIPNPKRLDLPDYEHQIDLFWKTEDRIATYFNIANAKWRSNSKVDQPDVLLLQIVREKVSAHKAVMITNSGFTAGAVAAAKDDGIALHVVEPCFDYSSLDPKNPTIIQGQLQSLAQDISKPMYSNQAVHRAYPLAGTETAITAPTTHTGVSPTLAYQTRVGGTGSNTAQVSHSNRRGNPGGRNRTSGGESRRSGFEKR